MVGLCGPVAQLEVASASCLVVSFQAVAVLTVALTFRSLMVQVQVLEEAEIGCACCCLLKEGSCCSSFLDSVLGLMTLLEVALE